MSNKYMTIIGGRHKSGNIGDGIATAMLDSGWSTFQHDAKLPDGSYGVPELTQGEWDADALVVSLGAVSMEAFEDVEPQDIDKVIRACLTLPLQVVHEYVRQRGPYGTGGKIILIGSYAHRHPFTNGVPYCAAKAGLDMAGKVLGWELTSKGFHTTVVHPYHVPDSPMWEVVQQGVMANRDMDRQEADDYAFKDNKMQLMDPYEIGCIVHMLCTLPEAAWLSGTNLELFGGTR